MKKDKKKIYLEIPNQQYKQIVDNQFKIFKETQKRVSMASIVRKALLYYFEHKLDLIDKDILKK